MTPRQILIVAIRLLALLWLFAAIGQIAGAVVAVEHGEMAVNVLWIAVGVQVLLCIFLWFFPATLASKLLRGGTEPVAVGTVPFAEWQDLCFVAVGTFVMARAVPNAVFWLILGVAPDRDEQSFTFEQKASAFAALFEVVMGLVLVFGARGLSNLVRHFRGRASSEESNVR